MKANAMPPTVASLGKEIDSLYRMRERIRKKEAEVKAMKVDFNEEKATMFKALGKQKLESAHGRLASVSKTHKTRLAMRDFDSFLTFVKKKRAWDLLTRSVSKEAWQERHDAGVEVPGIEIQPVVDLQLRKK